MSWVSSGREWLVETSTEDKARSHKYKNVPVSDQGYDVSILYLRLNSGVWAFGNLS